MARYLSTTLEKRGVSCVAELLDRDASRICEAVWWAGAAGERLVHDRCEK